MSGNSGMNHSIQPVCIAVVQRVIRRADAIATVANQRHLGSAVFVISIPAFSVTQFHTLAR